jgi:hypothetical protein
MLLLGSSGFSAPIYSLFRTELPLTFTCHRWRSVSIHNREKYGRFARNCQTVNVHSSSVLDFDFTPLHDNIIATASDDCLVAVAPFPEVSLKTSPQRIVRYAIRSLISIFVFCLH